MCEFLDSIEARGFKKGEKRGEKRGEKNGEKRGRETERRENKLVAEYLKSLGKSDEFSDLLDHPRKYRRYLKEAMAVYESVGG